MVITIGKQYRNKKHGTLYHALGFTCHSETSDIMVTYERVDPEEREVIPWSRPVDLFKEKFEEVAGLNEDYRKVKQT